MRIRLCVPDWPELDEFSSGPSLNPFSSMS